MWSICREQTRRKDKGKQRKVIEQKEDRGRCLKQRWQNSEGAEDSTDSHSPTDEILPWQQKSFRIFRGPCSTDWLDLTLVFCPYFYPKAKKQWETERHHLFPRFLPCKGLNAKDSGGSCTGNSLHVVTALSLQNLHTWDSHRLGWEFCA